MVQQTQSLAHTKWLCKYHIVFNPKYRRKVIFNQIKTSVIEILKVLCKYKGVEIIEGRLRTDHVHMLVSIPPKISVSSFMGYLKGKSSLMIFDKHANLKYKYGNRKFWAEGYYVSTVGLNEATIAKYIREQEKHDIAVDRLSVKEGLSRPVFRRYFLHIYACVEIGFIDFYLTISVVFSQTKADVLALRPNSLMSVMEALVLSSSVSKAEKTVLNSFVWGSI